MFALGAGCAGRASAPAPAGAAAPANLPAAPSCCAVVELRQYTLRPGKRDVLIDLFDREFIEGQEDAGATVIGQFRDLDHPDRFVWLRGFRDMPSRGETLKTFYGGPIWKEHREAANATMLDSDNVLLLRPARPGSAFSLESRHRAPLGAQEAPDGLVLATLYYFDAPATADFVAFFERTLAPAATEAGASVLASFVTEASANNFPALPVREGEHVFVWFSLFQSPEKYQDYVAALSRSPRWRNEVSPALAHQLKGAPEVHRLTPTARSALHG